MISKKFIVAASMAASAMLFAWNASAQNYEPRNSWPYLYEEFTAGSVRSSAGDVSKGEFNVDVTGKLHFISGDGKIMEAKMTQVSMAYIGDNTYINRTGRMAKVISQKDRCALILKSEPDYAQMDKSDIGYGMKSSLASTQNVTALSVEGTSLVNMEIKMVTGNKDEGSVIPIKSTYYFLINGLEYEAEKYAVSNIPGLDKAAFKAFQKAEKIKWNKEESLEKVLDFIISQKAAE